MIEANLMLGVDGILAMLVLSVLIHVERALPRDRIAELAVETTHDRPLDDDLIRAILNAGYRLARRSRCAPAAPVAEMAFERKPGRGAAAVARSAAPTGRDRGRVDAAGPRRTRIAFGIPATLVTPVGRTFGP